MAGAPVKSQGMAVSSSNYVAQDEIWKDHVRQEVKSCKQWPKDWAFLADGIRKLVVDEYPEIETKKRDRLKPTASAELPDAVKAKPSPLPLPRTSSSMIGWRSANPQCNLERYGGYAKPKGGLVKQFNWPTEGID